MRNLLKTAGALIIVLFTTNAISQNINDARSTEINSYDQGFRFGVGLSGGFPTDSKTYDFALGGDARLQYDLTRKASLMLTTGYTHIFGKDEDFGYVPVKGGFKYFVGESVYLAGEAGVAVATKGNNNAEFLWAPSIGWANDVIDISIRYEDIKEFNNFDQVALRLAYGFKL